ncbi:hypothetical protein ACMD2_07275, partial [Ananas comosus]
EGETISTSTSEAAVARCVSFRAASSSSSLLLLSLLPPPLPQGTTTRSSPWPSEPRDRDEVSFQVRRDGWRNPPRRGVAMASPYSPSRASAASPSPVATIVVVPGDSVALGAA